MQKADRITSVLLIMISIHFGYTALRLPGPIGGRGIGPGGLPFVVSSFLLIFGLALFYRSIKGKETDDNHPRIWPKFKEKRNLYIVILATIAYPALIYVLGYVICTFLFLLLLMKALGGYRWRYVGLLSALFMIFLYYAFKVWLYMPFPKGFFW